VVLIYKKGENIDYSNYGGISLSSTSYKLLSSVLLTRLSPHEDKIPAESSVWVSTYQIKYKSDLLHSSDTG
jgi:hypothetical protein